MSRVLGRNHLECPDPQRQTVDRGFPALGFADSLMSTSARSSVDEIYGGECISKNAYHPRQGLMLAQAIVELPMQSKGVRNKSVLLSLSGASGLQT